MMPPLLACKILRRRMNTLFRVLPKEEERRNAPCIRIRGEIGAIRRALYMMGCALEEIPDGPPKWVAKAEGKVA